MSVPGLPTHLIPYATCFAAAGAEFDVDPYLLAAMCDRESRGGLALRPRGPSGVGDGGHGHGLMQIDDRSWLGWLMTHDWWDPEVNIPKGAEILHNLVQRFTVDGLFDPLFCAVAGYNCGPGNVRTAIKYAPNGATPPVLRKLVDARTTLGNYASDCFERRDAFKSAAPTQKEDKPC